MAIRLAEAYIEVRADTSHLASDVSSAAGKVKPVGVSVDADTSKLTRSLSGLGASAGGATKLLGGIGVAGAGAFAAVGGAAGLAATAVAGIGLSVAAQNAKVGAAFSDMSSKVTDFMGKAVEPLVPVLTGFSKGLTSLFTSIQPMLTSLFEKLAPVLADFSGQLINSLKVVAPVLLQLAEAGIPVIAALGAGLMPIVQALVPVINSITTGFGGLATSLIGPIVGAVQTVLPLVSALLEPLTQIGQQTFPILIPLVARLATAVGGVLATAISVVAPLIPQVMQGFAGVLGAIVPLLPVIGQLVGTALTLAATLLTTLLPAIQPIIGVIVQLATQIGAALMQTLVALMPSLVSLASAFTQILTALLPVIPPVLNLALALIPVIPLVAQLATSLITALLPAVIPVINILVKMVDTILGPVTNGITWLLNTVAPYFQQFSVSLQNSYGGFIKPMLETFSGAVSGLSGTFTTTVDAIGRAWDGLKDRVSGPINTMKGWINDNLIDPLNTVTKLFGLTIPRFASGGSTSALGRQTVAGVHALAAGGHVRGAGTSTSDSIPALLSDNEFVMKAASVRKYGVDFMRAINAGQFAEGGLVGKVAGWLQSGARFATDKVFDGAARLLGAAVPAPAFANSMATGTVAKLHQLVGARASTYDSQAGARSGDAFNPSGKQSPNGANGLGPAAAAARAYVMRTFGINNIGGFARRNVAGTNNLSDHATGHAIDVMIANYKSAAGIAQGNSVADYFARTPGAFGTKYVIWRDQINSGGGWRPYKHPGGGGGDTLQHRDHVHVSVFDKGGLLDSGKLALNLSGKPERILDPRQTEVFDRLTRSRVPNTNTSVSNAPVYNIHIQSSGNVRDTLDEAMFKLRTINRGGLYAGR